jgi:hypothetical protein
MGNEIISKGALERLDIYSFTAFGQPYINHEWISEIIMAGTYSICGDMGLIIWRWFTVLVIILLALKLIWLTTQHNLSRIIILLCFGIVLSPGISFRVQLFSYLMLLILLTLIYSARNKNRFPSVFVVSMLFALWANLHGAFVLGIVVWFIYVTGYIIIANRERPKPILLLLFLLPLSATLLNPFGLELWKFIYRELSNPFSNKYITEWQRFSFAPRETPFFLVMTFTWVAYFLSNRKKDFAETVILFMATLMGILAVRNTPLFVILALPSLAYHMDGAFSRLFEKAGKGKQLSRIPIYISTALFVSLAVFFFARGIPDKWQISIGEDPVPAHSIAFLKKNNVKGNLWVPLQFGGYALFHLFPDIKVSIDGRWAMVYQPLIIQNNMDFAFHGTGGKWKKILEQHEADFALVEANNPAIQEMGNDLDWIWIFAEENSKLLVKKDHLASLRLPLKSPQIKPYSWP